MYHDDPREMSAAQRLDETLTILRAAGCRREAGGGRQEV